MEQSIFFGAVAILGLLKLRKLCSRAAMVCLPEARIAVTRWQRFVAWLSHLEDERSRGELLALLAHQEHLLDFYRKRCELLEKGIDDRIVAESFVHSRVFRCCECGGPVRRVDYVGDLVRCTVCGQEQSLKRATLWRQNMGEAS